MDVMKFSNEITEYWEHSSNHFMNDIENHLSKNEKINKLCENFLYTYEIDDVIKLFNKIPRCNINSVNRNLLTFNLVCNCLYADAARIIDRIEKLSNVTGWHIATVEYASTRSSFNKFKAYISTLPANAKRVNFSILFRPSNIIKNNYASTNKLSIDIYNHPIYHITDEKYISKIMKNGLVTKSKNKLGTYPECLHFITNLTHKGPICKIAKRDNEYVLIVDPKMQIDNAVLLKIDTAWCKNYGIKFSYDPTSASNCVLSYNCIPPNLISIVDENEYEEIYNNQLEAADFSMLH